MSATVDLWGWRARLRLARGQTINDVIAKIPAIESGLGTFRGAVRVYPTPDDLANRCELRVLDIDPHADAIPWPGPSINSITRAHRLRPVRRRHPLPRAVPSPARPVRRSDRRRQEQRAQRAHRQPGRLRRRSHLGHRPQEGHGARRRGHHASTGSPPHPTKPAFSWPTRSAILEARAALLAEQGQRVWEPTPHMPALVIIIDEYAELSDDAPDAIKHADSIARRGRAVAVNLVAATQRPTQKAMGQGAVRSQMDVRICFRVRERKDVDLILGQGMLTAGWHAHTLNAPGKFLIAAAEHDTPKRARAYLLTDQAVANTAAMYADSVRRSMRSRGERSSSTATRDGLVRRGRSDRPVTSASRRQRSARRHRGRRLRRSCGRALSLAPDDGTTVPEPDAQRPA